MFTLYFCDTEFTRKNFRKRQHFIRFQREYPELERDLTGRVTDTYFPKNREEKSFTPHEFLIYKAYQIMSRYAEDEELLNPHFEPAKK